MTTTTIPQWSGVLQDLPGSLGAAAADMGKQARLHGLYDEFGARIYDDSTHVEATEIRAMRDVLRRHPGAVLELAAGSGRLTVPLLRMGRAVTGLELDPSMIEILWENVGLLPMQLQQLLTVQQGDMTDFELAARFSVAVLGAASISILDEPGRARLFETVRRHLTPGGALLFSIVVPLTQESGEVDAVQDVTGRSGRRYRVHEHRSDGAEERIIGVYPITADGQVPTGEPVPICVGVHRVLTQESILAEVDRAGLVLRDTHVFNYSVQGLAEIFLEIGEPQ